MRGGAARTGARTGAGATQLLAGTGVGQQLDFGTLHERGRRLWLLWLLLLLVILAQHGDGVVVVLGQQVELRRRLQASGGCNGRQVFSLDQSAYAKG